MRTRPTGDELNRLLDSLSRRIVPRPPRRFDADKPPAPLTCMQRLKRVSAMPQGTLS